MRGDKVSFYDLKIDDKILLRYQKGNPNNTTYHVRGFVDGRIILRYWSRRWKSWKYAIETPYWWKLFSPNCNVVKGK